MDSSPDYGPLARLMDIKPGDVVSAVGAGGKTSLIFALAAGLNKPRDLKILLTTTTKIYAPESGFDRLIIGEPAADIGAGVYVMGRCVDGENKLRAFEPEILEGLIRRFDVALIEADGARGRPLKCPGPGEPAVIPATTKTVAVLSLRPVGSALSAENVHRADLFAAVTGARAGGAITVGHIARLAASPDGLFKNARGERILFVNKIETDGDLSVLTSFVKSIWSMRSGDNGGKFFDRMLAGSLRDNLFWEQSQWGGCP